MQQLLARVLEPLDGRAQRLPLVERRQGRRLREEVQVVGQARLVDLAHQLGRGQQVADPQAGQRHGLRERAQHHQVRVPGQERHHVWPENSWYASSITTRPVGVLAQALDLVRGRARCRSGCWASRRSSAARAAPAGCGAAPRPGTPAPARAARAMRLAAQDAREQRVQREGRLRDHHARARPDRDQQQRLDQLVRAVAGQDAVGAPARERGQPLEQLLGIEVGIARPGPLQRLLRARAASPPPAGRTGSRSG